MHVHVEIILKISNKIFSLSKIFLGAILAKLKKLDTIESAVKKIEAKLENWEKPTQRAEDFQTTAKKDIDNLKDGLNFTGHPFSGKRGNILKPYKDEPRLHMLQGC